MLKDNLRKLFNRREFIGAATALTGATVLGLTQAQPSNSTPTTNMSTTDMSGMSMSGMDHSAMGYGNNISVGFVNPKNNGFDPLEILTDFDKGKVSKLSNGQTLREFEIIGVDKEIEIAPGVKFPAWTYNGRVPGPTMRVTEGDRLRVVFKNEGSHPHTMHFHGIHPANMDGTPLNQPIVKPGEQFTYEFDAEPFGVMLYHCHAMPLKRHLHKGMYGAFIIDPKGGRPPAREFVMVMNGFDTNFDSQNDLYAVNTVAFEYARRAIPIKQNELVRIYLVNALEFDLLNSFHLHANMFDYYDTGTTLTPTLKTVDTIVQVQGQRGIIEFKYKHKGMFMFHPHVTEFTELGWMGHFNVVSPEDFSAEVKKIGLKPSWERAGLEGSTVPYKGGATQ